MHKLMCIVLSGVVIALCRAIRVVCLHDVSTIAIGVEGADQGEEEPSHHHVAPGMSLPHKPSQRLLTYKLDNLGLEADVEILASVLEDCCELETFLDQP
jgi:hypothetical protein